MCVCDDVDVLECVCVKGTLRSWFRKRQESCPNKWLVLCLTVLTDQTDLSWPVSLGQISPIYFEYIYNMCACTVLCN